MLLLGAGLLLALIGACQKRARPWLIVAIIMTALATFPALRLTAATALAAALLAAYGMQWLTPLPCTQGEAVPPPWSSSPLAVSRPPEHRGEGEEAPLATTWRRIRLPIRSPWFWLTLVLIEGLPRALLCNLGAGAYLYNSSKQASTVNFLEEKHSASRDGPFRFAGDDAILPPEQATRLGLPDARADGQAMGPRWNAAMAALLHPDTKGINLLSVRYWAAPDHRPAPGPDWRQATRDDYQGAAVYENPAALPRAWLSQAAVGYPTFEQALARVEKFDFDPRGLVIGDWEISADQLEWMTWPKSMLRKDQGNRPKPADYFSYRWGDGQPARAGQERITWLEDSPERLRLRIAGGQGTWLVLADTYFEGWEATLNFTGRPAVDRPRLIVPAYGLLRALPVPESPEGTVDVTFVYRPAAWRRGLLLSTGAAAMIVVLMAIMMIKPMHRKAEI